jgi:dihydrolipoamide dehydrogenase
MRELRVDVAVIGAGTAGLNARRAAEKAGKSFVLIESGPYGTTCARVGCMPSKLLIAAADAAHEVQRAGLFGVRVPSYGVDGAAVMERVRRERDRFAGGAARMTERIPAEHRLRGHARFVGPTTLAVDEDVRVEARTIVIATGSRPFVPPPFDALRDHVSTSDEVFEWPTLPKSLLVVGTGIVALELGQAMHRLGVQVAFLNPFEELGPFTDPALQAAARATLSAELELHLGVRDVEAKKVDGGVEVAWTKEGVAHRRTFERVLVAAGRRGNLEGLSLEATGLPLDARGRPPWNPRTCQCGDSPIFLAGDVSGHRAVLHEASDEGHIAGANAVLYPDVVAHDRRVPLAIAFTDPQMALIGSSHRELDPECAVIGEASFEAQGRATVMQANVGKARLYAERRKDRLIGAEILGPRAEHIAHLLAWAVQAGMTVQECLRMPFYHPVLEEGLRPALRSLARELDVVKACRDEDLSIAPGA